MPSSVSATIFDQFDAPVGLSHQPELPTKLGTGYTCIKILLLSANLIFVIFAIVLLAVGSYALSSNVNDLAGVTLPAGLIFIGAIMFILALLGGLSSWRESRVGLIIYLVFLLLIVLTLFALGIAVYVQKNNADTYIIEGWQYSPPDVRQALMIEFKCCGLQTWPKNTTTDCPPPNLVTIPTGQICLPLFEESLKSNFMTAGGCGIAFAVLMGTVTIFVVILLDGLTRRKKQFDLIAKNHSSIDGEIDDLSNDHRLNNDDGDQILSVENDDDDDDEDSEDDDDETSHRIDEVDEDDEGI